MEQSLKAERLNCLERQDVLPVVISDAEVERVLSVFEECIAEVQRHG